MRFPSLDAKYAAFTGRKRLLVNSKDHLVFVFVPRNASSSVKRSLSPFVYIQVYADVRKASIAGCDICAIVRDPVTRFVSAYRQVQKRSAVDTAKITAELPFWGVEDPRQRFAHFVVDVGRVGLYDAHLLPQCFYFSVGVEPDVWFICDHGLIPAVNSWASARGKAFRMGPRFHNASRNQALNHQLCAFLRERKDLLSVVHDLYAEDFSLYEEKLCARPS